VSRSVSRAEWVGALDALEARLTHQEEIVAGHRLDAVEGELTLPEGDMPPELMERAQALLARTRHLEQLAARRLSQRHRVERVSPYGGAPANYGSL
jgi:hypothetical protein